MTFLARQLPASQLEHRQAAQFLRREFKAIILVHTCKPYYKGRKYVSQGKSRDSPLHWLRSDNQSGKMGETGPLIKI